MESKPSTLGIRDLILRSAINSLITAIWTTKQGVVVTEGKLEKLQGTVDQLEKFSLTLQIGER